MSELLIKTHAIKIFVKKVYSKTVDPQDKIVWP